MTAANGKNEKVARALKSTFGFERFRPDQEGIVDSLMDGRDVFAVLPTGGGKSLCYQLPSHLLPGTGIVISPLISLMKDQVDAARERGLRADYLNSSLNGEEQSEVLERLRKGECDLLYVAPERFAAPGFLQVLERVKVCLFAIDEAHCISDWGHDFRPDYLLLAELAKRFERVPVAAFTATATLDVQENIVERLDLRRPHIVRASFDRPNLCYEVLAKGNVNAQIIAFLSSHRGESGIVYRTTRKSVEETAGFLSTRGVKALPYHAGMDTEARKQNQELFIRGEVPVIVATIAFGMGIDKADIRFVVHADLPKNIEGYYQETGRAGRDGKPAHCLLYFGRCDIPMLRYFIDKIENEVQRMAASRKLQALVSLVTAKACRRRGILRYFGERYSRRRCTGCDVCNGSVETRDATRDAQILMSAIARTGQRYGASHIVDIVVGSETPRMEELKHKDLKTYGVGKAKPKRYWWRLVDELLVRDYIERKGEKYPVLGLTGKSERVLRKGKKFKVTDMVGEACAA